MSDAVIVALIGFCGTIVAALITAYGATRRGKNEGSTGSDGAHLSTRDGGVGRQTKHREGGAIRARTSSGKLVVRVIAAVGFMVGIFYVGETWVGGSASDPENVVLLGLFGLFGLVAAISLFRLVFRLLWALFTA